MKPINNWGKSLRTDGKPLAERVFATDFNVSLRGENRGIHVVYYHPEIPCSWEHPGEPEELLFHVLQPDGKIDLALDGSLTEEEEEYILEQAKAIQEECF